MKHIGIRMKTMGDYEDECGGGGGVSGGRTAAAAAALLLLFICTRNNLYTNFLLFFSFLFFLSLPARTAIIISANTRIYYIVIISQYWLGHTYLAVVRFRCNI